MRFSHQDIDVKNELQDRLLARQLRRDTRLIRVAQANLRRWKARDGKRVRAASFRGVSGEDDDRNMARFAVRLEGEAYHNGYYKAFALTALATGGGSGAT